MVSMIAFVTRRSLVRSPVFLHGVCVLDKQMWVNVDYVGDDCDCERLFGCNLLQWIDELSTVYLDS